jgi:hypothetical protein
MTKVYLFYLLLCVAGHFLSTYIAIKTNDLIIVILCAGVSFLWFALTLSIILYNVKRGYKLSCYTS